MAGQNDWHLGQTSIKYETGGRGAGTISTGKGDRGGVSYGSYQLSSKMGTLQEYLDQSPYKNQFKGLEPTTPAFNAKWRELARNDPEFAKDQHDFIKETHYDVQNDKLKARSLDLSGRGPVVQDALWSTSVQFRNLTPGIFAKGLQEKFGKDYKLSELSDKDIVEAVQDYKINHNKELFSKSPKLWDGLLERARNEKADLLQLADRNLTVGKDGTQRDAQSQERTSVSPRQQADTMADGVLRQGEKSKDIEGLQRSLNQLGFRDAQGRALAEDGDYGRRTKEAVEAFQHANGLKVDGIAGPDTLTRIGRQLPGQGQVTATAEITSPVAAQPRTLADSGHPDHALYRQAYDGLQGIDPQQSGLRSEQELRNAAGTLAFEARVSGLTRIDHVVANRDGSGLFAVQRRTDDPSHHRIYVDRAQAAAQPLERSTQQLEQEAQQQTPQREQQRDQQQRDARIVVA
jgi:peptidoglycan hydrolase-like protein with peptidoglycan-binding domain